MKNAARDYLLGQYNQWLSAFVLLVDNIKISISRTGWKVELAKESL
jgi:hypothetical protein